MKRSKAFGILIISLAILLGTAAILWKASQKQHMPPRPSTAVYVTTVTQKTWQPSISATGILVAEKGITIKTETTGRVTGLYFSSGDEVEKKQKILTLDNKIQTAERDYAQAQLTQSEHTYKRYKRLIKKNAISQEDFDSAAYTYQSNLAQLNQAEANLSYTVIYAPFSGKMGITNITIGDYLAEGDEIASLQQLNPMYVDFSIPEIYSHRFNLKSKVILAFKNLPNKTFKAQIIATNSYIDLDTGSLTVRASMPNDDNSLLPGHFTTATLYLDSPQQVLLAPQTAVLYSETGRFVYLVNNKKVKQTTVTTGAQVGQSIIITKGVKKGDTIVSVGGDKLHDGDTITIAPKDPAKTSSAKTKTT